MEFMDDDLYGLDDRGLNGFDRIALDFVSSFLEKLQRGARVYGLDGNAVMLLSQATSVVGDFLKVDYDGYVKITATRDDGLGLRSSDLEITPDKILIGVSGKEAGENKGEPYNDPYFIIGAEDENPNLDNDLEVWEEDFFTKLTFPETTLVVEGEVTNINDQFSQREAGSDEDWLDD